MNLKLCASQNSWATLWINSFQTIKDALKNYSSVLISYIIIIIIKDITLFLNVFNL